MGTGRRGNPAVAAAVFGILALSLFLALKRGRPSGNDPDAQVAPPSGLVRRPGIALAVLVDASGSMGDSVVSGGMAVQKMVIARRAVLSLLRKTDDFARRNPSQPLAVGVYEFNLSGLRDVCRPVIPLGKPDLASAEAALARMRPGGNTPIGDAMIAAKKDLDRAGMAMSHLLVVTDGENTHGPEPGTVAAALSRLPPDDRPAVYFVAFDIEAAKFQAVKAAGGLVVSAADEKQLSETLDVILGEKILLEK